MKNILICSAGRRVALVRAFQKESKNLMNGTSKVFTTDLIPNLSAACQVSDGAFKVGRFDDLRYIPQLLALCQQEDIKMVIPTIDTELKLLANHHSLFQEHGIELIVSDSHFVDICRDKRETNIFFKKCGFKIPLSKDPKNLTFPVFIKPINGSNSKDIYLAESEKMLPPYFLEGKDFMFMEYLSRDVVTEYTVDMYYDKNCILCCAVPRVRLEVRGGEVSKSITRKNELLGFLKSTLPKIEGARGCITLQCFLSKHDPSVIYGIEINPRFGGGYPLSYAAGAAYPNWLIREYFLNEGLDYTEEWLENTLMIRYDEDFIVKNAEY